MSTLAPLPGSKPDMQMSFPSAQPSPYEKLMAKHAIKAADPAIQPHSARRQVMQERLGSAYRVTVPLNEAPHTEPAAGATLSRGRVLPTAVNRSAVNFQSGLVDFN